MHAAPSSLAVAAVIAALIVFQMYRRIRRSIGRQALKPTRLRVRMVVLLAAAAALVARSPAFGGEVMVYAAAGAAVGLALAWYALRHTRVERIEGAVFYTGHPYIGLGIAVLMIGRVLYRLVQVYPLMQAPAAHGNAGGPNLAASLANAPTTGIALLVVGYYVAYYAGLLAKLRGLPPAAA